MSLIRGMGVCLALASLAFGCRRAAEEAPVPVVESPAPEAPRESKPVCALVDIGKTPQAAMLQAKLLSDSSATWVERENIDAVLKEQQLQAAFGPQGVADRVKLGKLLKADLLVLVRLVKDAKEAALEVVVSETAGGLRLLVRGVTITGDSDADVAALLAAVRNGFKKHGEKIREVVAVPPFVSNDLEFTFDHLKGALAKLAETEAMHRPGIVAVELEEARALARELALTGSKLDRPLPLYLLGEYRNEGKGAARTMTLKLRAERSGQPVGAESSRTVKADAATGAVREWAAARLDGLANDAARPLNDPTAEAKQLAARAGVFTRLGNWEEASALYEASLLLNPDQPEILIASIRPLIRLMQKLPAGGPTPEAVRALRSHQQLAIGHLEALATRGDNLKSYTEQNTRITASEFLFAMRSIFPRTLTRPAHWPVNELDEIEESRRQFCLRMIPRTLTIPQGESLYVLEALATLHPRERHALAEQMLKSWKGLGDERARAATILRVAQGGFTSEAQAEYRAFLARLESSGDPLVREAVTNARAEWERFRTQIPTSSSLPTPNPAQFTPIHVVHESTGLPLESLLGSLPIGPKRDIVWNSTGLHLMREKGRALTVWSTTTPEPQFSFRTVIFDGRYVWASTATNYHWPYIVVYDTRSGRVRTIGAKEGLPQGSDERLKVAKHRYIELASIETGKVCAVGTIGRAWIATVSMDESGQAAVKIVHEAREIPDPRDETQGRKSTVDFVPTFVLPAGSGNDRRIVIGRTTTRREDEGSNQSVQRLPLVFDPATGNVSVLEVEFYNLQSSKRAVFAANGRLLTVNHSRNNQPEDRIDLQQLQFPGPTVTAIGKAGPEAVPGSGMGNGCGLIHEDRLIFHWTGASRPKAGERVEPAFDLWSVKLDGTQPRLLIAKTPLFGGLHMSAHYGLITTLLIAYPAQVEAQQITLEGSPPVRSARHPKEGEVKSASSANQARFTIVNSAKQPIRLFWLDDKGLRRLYREIPAGGRIEQLTYVGHAWLIADADDNAWKLIRVNAAAQTIEITGPDKP